MLSAKRIRRVQEINIVLSEIHQALVFIPFEIDKLRLVDDHHICPLNLYKTFDHVNRL